MIHGRAHRSQHRKDLINVDELVDRFDGQRNLVLSVFYMELDLAPMHAACFIQLSKSHAHAIDHGDPPYREGTGKIIMRTNCNGRVRDTAWQVA